jgi:hypothetical protein
MIRRIEARFLIGGETSIYYWRTDPGNYDNPPDGAGNCDDGDRDKYRAQYLANFPTIAWPKIEMKPYPEVTIVWQDQDAYRSEFVHAVDEQRTFFRNAVMALTDHGLTTEEAESLKPHVEVVIRDYRSDQSTPLPVISSDASMEVVAAFRKPLN